MTSPSGHHLGIYKSLQCHVKEKSDNALPTPTQDAISQGHNVPYVIFDIMNLALKHTHTLEQWKTVHQSG